MNKKKSKKNTKRKVIKWVVGIFLTIIILLAASPYLFKDKIKEMLLTTINKNINATVSFDEVDLSLFRNFPLADVSINQLKIINKAPFEGDTLLYANEFHLQMKITELFKGKDETIQLESFSTQEGEVNILINEEGITNYDIAVQKESSVASKEASSFSLNIQEYSLSDIDFSYYDKTTNIEVKVDSIYHTGKGNFAQETLDLDTQTSALLSVNMNGVNYMDNVQATLDAIVGIDIQNLKYTFKDNNGFINQLPLEFDGFIQLVGENQDQYYDLEFKTPTSTFKNLLGVLPSQYSGNLDNVETKGNFDMKGVVKGTLTENTIPTFDITFASNDAMFKYPELPKAVQNITLNSRITNTTGDVNDTRIDINKLTFTIDRDVFNAEGHINNLVKNPNISLNAKGDINLENLSKAYPLPQDLELSGLLKADVTSKFDMNSIEKKLYENIKNSGTISLQKFKYDAEDVAKPFLIEESSVVFNTKRIELKKFEATTGDSDIKIQGNLDNFYGFLFKDEVLQGNFTLTSNQIKVADFMTATTAENEADQTQKNMVKVPKFLDCTFSAKANSVIYDNIRLSNASGKLLVKNQAIDIQDLKTSAFGGLIKMNGQVSTKEEIPNFKMNLQLENVNIKESFSQLETLSSIAPIANTIGGKLNSTIKMTGNLLGDMTPNLKSISGDLLGQLLNTKLDASESKVLSVLGNELNFIDVSKLDLSSIKTYLSFENGNVVVKPFDLKYKDINISIGGTHGFDQSMNYNVTFDIPAKYLGEEITNLVAKISSKEARSIPVKASVTGSFSNPSIQTDIKEATKNLAKKLADEQKAKLVDKGKNKLLNLFNKGKDSTKTKKDSTGSKAKSLLKNLFKKKKKDS